MNFTGLFLFFIQLAYNYGAGGGIVVGGGVVGVPCAGLPELGIKIGLPEGSNPDDGFVGGATDLVGVVLLSVVAGVRVVPFLVTGGFFRFG